MESTQHIIIHNIIYTTQIISYTKIKSVYSMKGNKEDGRRRMGRNNYPYLE